MLAINLIHLAARGSGLFRSMGTAALPDRPGFARGKKNVDAFIRLRFSFWLLRIIEELPDRYGQGIGDRLNVVDGDVALASFHRANIGPVQTSHFRQLLLAEPSCKPLSAHVVGEKQTSR